MKYEKLMCDSYDEEVPKTLFVSNYMRETGQGPRMTREVLNMPHKYNGIFMHVLEKEPILNEDIKITYIAEEGNCVNGKKYSATIRKREETTVDFINEVFSKYKQKLSEKKLLTDDIDRKKDQELEDLKSTYESNVSEIEFKRKIEKNNIKNPDLEAVIADVEKGEY